MEPLIAALLQPQAYDHPVEGVQLLETHISWILLTGTYAYKIKKPVDLGFVDFSSLARRRHFCAEELRLNRRLAPDLYLGLRTIHGPAQRAHFGGGGPEIELAVQMRQFRQCDLLPALLRRGLPLASLLLWVEDLADRLALFHAGAAIAPAGSAFGTAEAVRQPALANLAVLERLLGPQDHRLPPLRQWCDAEALRLEPLFERRHRGGRVREGHGDLHLGNLVLHQGQIAVFDCLEFSPALRWIDVISDLAFLAMDLRRHRHTLLAAALLNHWLTASGDYGALATWRWYVAYRALVRAKVTALRLEQQVAEAEPQTRSRLDLQAYLHLAASVQRWRPPLLLITHGVSGSGKSYRGRWLAQRLGWLHIRSDVERLRLFGRWGEPCGTPLQGDPYAPEVSELLYRQRLSECCAAALEAGCSLICDATFLRRWQRLHFRSLAERLGARLVILPCPCSPELARRRIAQRRQQGGDPSEADAAVLEAQLGALEPLEADERPFSLNLETAAASLASPDSVAVDADRDESAPQVLLESLLRQLRALV
jgi:aminoglycoside phosphotransferase family enzyme/predicted kinase